MDLLSSLPREREEIAPGVLLLPDFADGAVIMPEVERIASEAPFRAFMTPYGRKMSVAMTNCGEVGWISDVTGYRYADTDPLSGDPWPEMPEAFSKLAMAAAFHAGTPKFLPDVCLINAYDPGTKLSLHQDRDEKDFSHPIVSVSLGLSCIFLWGGARRQDPVLKLRLQHGDVLVFGGPSRLNYHGVEKIEDGCHPLTGHRRINLTFRKAR